MGSIILIVSAIVFVAALLDAAWGDLRALRIPNRVPLTVLAAFVPAALSMGLSGEAWLVHLGTGVLSFVAAAVLFSLGVWGGGDAKLAPAVLLWVGPADLPRFLLVMALVGGLVALAALVARRAEAGGLRPAMGGHVPYGIAIAAGGLDWAAASLLPRLAG
ncbi:Putative Flp pilus assembly protein, protease CpaA (Prepilin type IV endopeptidase, peptidase domain; 11-115) [Magnetospirillum sp. XM-1]|uniref:A24 family peptidase n=1 Tax=Magnetospirillum sp. XM-1 TaxID=1663591 RepID=UPI00073DDFD6|nr:prepilin peptidase [Magnetospirillum sp. XM-1]CUW38426.1 Putative Flp pilus assembly protein, protease CpaA (Prepilin type IV endopeptidase, peptidase domain; 11-115) [Magnetospirillum sp. XM-1]